MRTILVILGLTIVANTFAQQTYLDSLIMSKKPRYIEGIVPVYVIPGYETKAISWQSTITEAKNYYENKYKGISIKAKLAVLDSANWTTEIVGYGYTYARDGWIVLPADVDFNDYVRIYGFLSFKNILREECDKIGLDPNELPGSMFQFVTVHELGHILVKQLIKEGIPGEFLNETVANVIAWEFFKKSKPEAMRGFELSFNVFFKNYTNPKYKTLTELSENYGKMDIENYCWYQFNFLKLVEEIYAVKDVDLLLCFKKLGQENNLKDMNIIEIGSLLDKYYNGIFSKWLAKYN
jgi:hypothetical protein